MLHSGPKGKGRALNHLICQHCGRRTKTSEQRVGRVLVMR